MTQTEDKGGGALRRPKRFGMVVIGALGVLVLIALCIWQVQRLSWKEGVIATLESRLSASPVALSADFDPATQEFSRVVVTGHFPGGEGTHGYPDAPLLTSLRPAGPGYRIIQPFQLSDGRRIMVDRGYVPVGLKNIQGKAARPTPAPEGTIKLTGALRWPEETGDPPFGASDNVWTARDLTVMSRLFNVEPVLLIAETDTSVGDWPQAQPLRAVNIRNNHLEYALTWAALAIAWAVMTAYLAFRPR